MRKLQLLALMLVASLSAMAQSKVYFTKEITPEALLNIYKAMGVELNGRVAVKISTGEAGNPNYLKPTLIKDLVDEVNGTIVECNTAYGGKRNTFAAHWQTVHEHGYDSLFAVDLMDEDGEMRIPVKDKSYLKYNIVGSHLARYTAMINLAHFKGHPMGGYGGVLKNASIGVASSNGKAYIHTAGKQATLQGMWKNTKDQDGFLRSMAAAAQSVHEYFGGKVLYINVMNNMSVDCDCVANPAAVNMKDVGILASTDPVALDQACVDIIFNTPSTAHNDSKAMIERIKSRHGTLTIDHAEKIGLGTKKYKIVNLDK